MAPEDPRWIQWLIRVAARGSEAAVGDALEEYASGGRGALWLCRQILSTSGRRRSRVRIQGSRSEMLSNFISDVRYALRTFRRNPGFALAAVAPIALGIGINTMVFSLANAVLFKQLPYRDPSRLMLLWDGLDWIGVPEAWVTGVGYAPALCSSTTSTPGAFSNNARACAAVILSRVSICTASEWP